MPAFFNVAWLNSNTQRAYPFTERATRRDVTESIQIPDSFLVELYLPVAAVVETLPDRFYLRRLGIIGGGYTIEIAYNDGTDDHPIVASTSISSLNFTEYSRYALVGINLWDDTVGKVVIGSLDAIARLPAGVYEFEPDDGALDPDTIRPIIRGVSSIATEQGGQRGPKLRNNVVFQAGRNMRLTTILRANEDPVIRFDAIPDETFDACLCVEKDPPCIRTINDIPGDARQNFTLLGDDCIKITPITNGLQFTDDCCAPCCGCNELEEVLRALSGVRSSAITLENFLQRLAREQDQLRLVLVTKQGCDDCGVGTGESEAESDATGYLGVLFSGSMPEFTTMRLYVTSSDGQPPIPPELGTGILNQTDELDAYGLPATTLKNILTTGAYWSTGVAPFHGSDIDVLLHPCAGLGGWVIRVKSASAFAPYDPAANTRVFWVRFNDSGLYSTANDVAYTLEALCA